MIIIYTIGGRKEKTLKCLSFRHDAIRGIFEITVRNRLGFSEEINVLNPILRVNGSREQAWVSVDGFVVAGSSVFRKISCYIQINPEAAK